MTNKIKFQHEMEPQASYNTDDKNETPPPSAFLKLLLFLIQRSNILYFAEQSSLRHIVIGEA